MFDRLPTELVRQIIESTVPSTYHSYTYGDRQRLLRSLSLVCHLFRDLAQPLLREIVYLDAKKSMAQTAWNLRSYDWAVQIRQARICVAIKDSSTTVLLETLATSCPNLEILNLSASDDSGTELEIITRLLSMYFMSRYTDLANVDS